MDWRTRYRSICDAPALTLDYGILAESHPARQFNEYWHSLAGGTMPDRAAFSPQGPRLVLKWLMLFRRVQENGAERFHLYLQGTSAAELTHGLLQGKYLDEFATNHCLESRLMLIRGSLETGQPQFGTIDCSYEDSEFSVSVDVGAFPFTKEGAEPEVFMVVAPRSVALRCQF